MIDREKSCEIPGRPSDSALEESEFIPVRPAGSGKPFAGVAPKVNFGLKNIDLESAVNLTLPKAFFGVTGVECRIILNNLVVLHNKKQLHIKVSSPIGTVSDGVWRYTPDCPGRYPFAVEVTDLAGRQIGAAESEIIISDVTAGNDQNISMLMIGDSLFAKGETATFLLENMQAHGNQNFYLVGSHSGAGRPLEIGKAAVEAYGGWRWGHFVEKYGEGPAYNARSKFLKQDAGGKLHLDFKAYLEKYHQGKVPDVIVILLGCNDIAHACIEDFDEWMASSRSYRKQLLDHIRENAPGAIIGLVTLPPANLRNKAYIENYHGNVVFQQFVYNQIAYVKQMLLDYQDDPEYSIVPIYQMIDGMEDFPVDNAIHPAESGYRNFAAAIDGGEGQIVTHKQLLRSMMVMEAAFRSDALGAPVAVEDIETEARTL